VLIKSQPEGVLRHFQKEVGGTRLSLVIPVASHVNHHGAGQNQHIVFTLRDLHSVGIAQREPLL
jgi:hypothetical protein